MTSEIIIDIWRCGLPMYSCTLIRMKHSQLNSDNTLTSSLHSDLRSFQYPSTFTLPPILVLSRYLISRCDTYRDTWVTMRYVSRYLFIALVSPQNCNLSMMAVQYIVLGTLYAIMTIGAEYASRWPLPSY